MAVAYQAIELTDEQWEVFITITANQIDGNLVTKQRIIEVTGLPSKQVSQNLDFLKKAGLIIGKRIEI